MVRIGVGQGVLTGSGKGLVGRVGGPGACWWSWGVLVVLGRGPGDNTPLYSSVTLFHEP